MPGDRASLRTLHRALDNALPHLVAVDRLVHVGDAYADSLDLVADALVVLRLADDRLKTFAVPFLKL